MWVAASSAAAVEALYRAGAAVQYDDSPRAYASSPGQTTGRSMSSA